MAIFGLNKFDDGHFEVEDLGSTNGTYIEGKQIAPHVPVAVTAQQRITPGPQAGVPWPVRVSMRGAFGNRLFFLPPAWQFS